MTVPPLVLAALAAVRPAALLVLVPALLLALAGPRAWDRLLAERGKDHWDTYEGLGADYLEALQGMPALRAAGAVGRTRERLERRSAALHRATVAKLRVSLVDTGITDLAVQGGTAAAALLACWSAVTGATAATGTYLMLLLASECFRPVRDLAREWHAGYLGASAADGIAALRTAPPAVPDEGTAPARWPGPPDVRFEDVDFTYDGADAPALRGVTFTAEAGRTTAIVGPSGAGKSTLLALLLRHHDPRGGRVLLGGRCAASTRWTRCAGTSPSSPRRRTSSTPPSPRTCGWPGRTRLDRGADPGGPRRRGAPTEGAVHLIPGDGDPVDLRDVDDAELRRAVAVVGQDTPLFHGTLADNLRLAAPDADDDRLAEVARLCGVDRIAPLDTLVGERGATLSGGQRARIALARALLTGPRVLVLDESTAHLDNAGDAELSAALRSAGRTTVVIAHRRATVRRADRVAVLEGGRIAEEGTWEELTARPDSALNRILAGTT
ncbi:Vitamin B12 import ATP-binding protein BtuD [Streptomyces fumanus]